MFTPQQLEQISFDKAVFGGYDMESVDEFLEPLLEDYTTLYKDNATLKSKMRVLVEKLEEYRKSEGSVQEALRSAQKTCDAMVREAEAKCLKMLHQAQSNTAPQPAPLAAPAGNTLLNDAKTVTREGIESMEAKLREIQEKLAELKAETEAQPEPQQSEPAKSESEDEVAREIAENLEKLVGTTEDTAPVAPRPARPEGSTGRFTNLQFGKNYDPTKG